MRALIIVPILFSHGLQPRARASTPKHVNRAAPTAPADVAQARGTDCESVEDCEVEAVEHLAAARAMYMEAKTLRAQTGAEEAELARARAEAAANRNNVLPFRAARGKLVTVWRTTLKVFEAGDAKGREAFCRAAFTFKEGNRAEVAVTPSNAACGEVVGDGGWRLHATPQTPGDYRNPDLFECWCYVTRKGAEVREKVTLRTTCMPLADAETALAVAREARLDLDALEAAWTDAQDALAREPNLLKKIFKWHALFRMFDDREMKSAVKNARKRLAETVGGFHVTLDGEVYALGAFGNYVVDGDTSAPSIPGPVTRALARFLPAARPNNGAPVGLFTTWRS